MRRIVLALACVSALLAITPPADAQAVRAMSGDAHHEMPGPLRIAVPVSPEKALRAAADSALAEAMVGGAEAVRVDSDIYEPSRYVGIGMAVGAVAGLIVGAIARTACTSRRC